MTQSQEITFRDATIDDLVTLQFWQKQPHVQENIPGDDWNWEIELYRKPAWRQQLIAEHDGEPIGFLQIIDPHLEETHYWGIVEPNLRAIDIWIGEAKHLNKGYGTQMLKRAMNLCFKDPSVSAILLDPLKSNQRAQNLYSRLGFKFIEERSFDGVVSNVFQLTRQDWSKQ